MIDMRKIEESMRRVQERFDKMTPEERQMHIQGYTNKQYDDYKSNSFSTDIDTLKKYIAEHGCYNSDDIAYKNKPQIDFINSKLFMIVFNDESIEVHSKDYSSKQVLNDIIRIDYSGMGSITVFRIYEPSDNDIQYCKNDGITIMKIGNDVSVMHNVNDPDSVSLTLGNNSITKSKSELRKIQKVLNSFLGEEDNKNEEY